MRWTKALGNTHSHRLIKPLHSQTHSWQLKHTHTQLTAGQAWTDGSNCDGNEEWPFEHAALLSTRCHRLVFYFSSGLFIILSSSSPFSHRSGQCDTAHVESGSICHQITADYVVEWAASVSSHGYDKPRTIQSQRIWTLKFSRAVWMWDLCSSLAL